MERPFLFAAGVIACTVFVITLESGQEQPAVSDVNQHAEQAKPDPPAAPVVLPPDPASDGGATTGKPVSEDVDIQRQLAAATERLADDTHDLANYTLALVVAGGFVGFFQLLLLVFQSRSTAKAATAAVLGARADLLAQRGYLAVSHMPEGLHQIPGDLRHRVVINVKNDGRTPVTVHESRIRPIPNLDLLGMPANLPDDAVMPGGYLTPRRSFRAPLLITFSADDMARIQAGDMWIAGYTDYTDAFGQRHRRGYCRHVEPNVVGNNLSWDEVSARHNYDAEVDEQGNRQPQKRH